MRSCLRRMQASDTGYFRERLSGVDPNRIRSADDLRRLPFTVKDDLREHYPFGHHFVPEIVDPDTGEPLPEGEVGELVLSAPTKEAFPVLRYRTRDLTRITREPCPCGRTGARISKILGRTDDMMKVRGVNVFPSQIEHALLGVDGLEPHYQVVLGTRPDMQTELRVRVESAVAAKSAIRAALEARVTETLRDSLGLCVPVELAPAGTMPRSEGKAVRVLDRRTLLRS